MVLPPLSLSYNKLHLQESYFLSFHCVSSDLPRPFKEPALTTTASRTNPFFLTVALSAGGWAHGDLFWDDGDSLDTFEMGNYCYVVFLAGEVGEIRQIILNNWMHFIHFIALLND